MSYYSCNYYFPGLGELPTAIIPNGSESDVVAEMLRAQSDGAELAVVVPENFDAFKRLGFSDFFMIERTPIRRDKIGEADEKIIDLPAECVPECGEIFFQVARWRGHVGRSAELWSHAAEKETNHGGGVVACERDGAVAGYAFYRRDGEQVVIDEIFCEDEPAFIALQRAVLDRCGVDSAVYCAPACPHGAERFGMIYALDCKAVIEFGLKRRQGDFEIEVADDTLGSGAHYAVRDGNVEVSERRGVAAITPGQLASIILGGGPAPYVNMVFC